MRWSQVLLGRGGEEQLRGLLQSGSIAFSFGYYTVFRFLPASFRAEDSAQSYQPSSRAEALTRICQAAQPFGQPARAGMARCVAGAAAVPSGAVPGFTGGV